MIDSLRTRSDATPAEAGEPRLGLIGRSLLVLVVVYLVMNRIVPDVMVLPVGFSLRPYEIVMALILGVWGLWMITERPRFPVGLLGLVGLGLVALLTLAPFVNGLGMDLYQANGAQRGLFRVFLLAGLFLAAYHLGRNLVYAKRLLAWVIAATVFQALLGMWEFVTRIPLTFMFDLSRSAGLVFDPSAIRSELTTVISRQTGELRAVATAPHPIVLSAVIALGVIVSGVWLIYTDNSRTRRWLALSAAVLVLAMPVANSRTGFVMLAAAVVPLLFLLGSAIPRLIPWSLALVLAMGLAFAISPQTPRLLLDSVTRSDQDVNTQQRLERFERLPELLDARPILGAGYLTHDPDIQIFDNAYNLGLIEFGILGLVVTVWWMLIALMRSWTAARYAVADERVLATIGVLTVVALLAASATFDAWTFDQYFPTSLIVLGAALGTSDVVVRRARDERRTGSTDPIPGALTPHD